MAYGFGFAMVLWWVPMLALMVVLITALVRLAPPGDRLSDAAGEPATVPVPQVDPPHRKETQDELHD